MLLPRRNPYAWFHEICVRVGPSPARSGGVPCHTLNGNGLAGKPVSDLMDKMKAYQSGTFTDAKLLGMQQVLKPLSDKQLLDLAAYINKM